MNLNLEGKTALVCGSSKGIGKSCALELAKSGCKIIALSRSSELLEKLFSELSMINSSKHEFVTADLSNTDELISKVKIAINSQTIDILINNAGGPKSGPILNASREEFLSAFETHLVASLELSRLLIPKMIEQKYGRIINIISTSIKTPLVNLGVSNSIRAAVASWSKTLSNEVAEHGITVNSVLPGATDTDRLSGLIKAKAQATNSTEQAVKQAWINDIPAKRFGTPEEIAYLVSFLSSSFASYINGTAIAVDGGRTRTLT